MKNLVYLSDVNYDANRVLTVGTFDGVHHGHRAIIEKVVDIAQKKGSKSAVVTFDPHPRDILNPGKEGIKLLTTLDERAQIVRSYGIDELIVIPFTRDFSLLSSDTFILDYIHKRIGVSAFVIGYDHHFGRDRKGSIETLTSLSSELGFSVDIVGAHEVDNVTISSTIVRKKLETEGNIAIAREFLGRPYQLSGTVIHGDKRGRLIGYPTANLKPVNERKIIPHDGVYAVDVAIDNDSELRRGMMNIGIRPTFKNSFERVVEVHIIDFDADLYGKTLTVHFLKRIRNEKTFSGLDELRSQLDHDRESCLSV